MAASEDLSKKFSEMYQCIDELKSRALSDPIHAERTLDDVLRVLQVGLTGSSKGASGKPQNELAEANEALRVREERFKLAMYNLPDAFAIYDPDLRFWFANARGIELCGRTADELLGHTDEELFPPEVVNNYLPIMLKAVEIRKAQSGEMTMALPGGTITCTATYIPLLDDSGAIIVNL